MAIVTIPLAGQYGVITDQQPQELPINAWSYASNMRFRDGCAERFGGEGQIFTSPSVTPYYIQPFTNVSGRYWIHAGLTSIYSDDGTTRTNITGTAPTGAIDDRWTGGSLNGVAILNNGIDVPQYWGGTGTFANLTAWPANTRVSSLRPFKNYLVGLDVLKNKGTTNNRYPHMVKWSHAADPGTIPSSYDETDATKDAGEVDLAEEPSLMVDQLPMGDMNIIYKERSMYGMSFIGQPNIWRFQRLPGDIGALARGCVASTPIGHVVLTAGDVILHSGQGPQSIINAKMRRWLFNQIDSTNYKRAFVSANPARNEVWICFPTAGDTTCRVALVWNWTDATWTIRSLNNVTYAASGQINYAAASAWSSDTEAWQNDATSWNQDPFSPADHRLLTVGTTPIINLIDNGVTFNGSTFTSTIERTGMAFDAPDTVKTIRHLVPRIDAASGTQIRIQFGGAMDAEKGPTWSDPITYTVGSSYKADGFATGRFLAIRLTSMDDSYWRLKSMDVDIVKSGMY